MLRFWIEAIVRAMGDTLAAIGKDPADLRFSLLVLAIVTLGVFIRDGIANGWRGMKERLRGVMTKDAQIVIILCGLVFIYNVLHAPFSMWDSESQKYEAKSQDFLNSERVEGACSADLKIERNKADLQQAQLISQQETVNSQQGTVNSLQNTLNKQQAAVTTCVGDLAKAIIPEPSKTSMMLLPFSEDHSTKHVAYMLLVTNKPITPIHLALSCDAYVHQFEVLPADGSAFGGSTEKTTDGRAAVAFLTFPTWTAEKPLVN
jgi:uncharacterized membrane protein YqaE (UPF0057 family)